VFSYFNHAFVVAIHAVYALTCLSEDEFVDTVVADLALEAVCMIGIVTGHDSLVENRKLANVAAVRTICANRRAV
jgi:hypothetical protein